MPVLRRFTALVTMVVTLVLVLAESGFACSMDGMADTRAVAAGVDAMPGMDMPGMPTRTGDDGAPEQTPCRFPWAPGGCQDMAPCAPAALAVAPLIPTPAATIPDARVASRVTAPTSIDTPPEPPPPRA